MKTWLQHLADRLRTSFWFVPSLFAIGSFVIAGVMLKVDREFKDDLLTQFPGLAEISASGTRELISTAATAMLSLAGITFSGVLVAMTLASNRFGPRLLRNFIRARSTQITLGMLLSTFIYCLLVLRGIRSQEETEFVPHAAALAGFVGTMTSLAVFIYFIHHITTSLQADRVTEKVFCELREAIDRFFPKRPSSDAMEEAVADRASDEWEELSDERALDAPRDGYLQALDLETLVEVSADLDTRLRVLKRPGHFVVEGDPILAFSGDFDLDEEAEKKLRNCFIIGSIRTPEQDFEFEIRQLVEVALRALSPGINDPFTAMNCIDFLGAALNEIGHRQLPAHLYRDGNDIPRVLTRPVSFESLLGSAFHQLRQVAGPKPDVVIRMLEALALIDQSKLDQNQRKAVCHHARTIFDAAKQSKPGESDLEDIERRMEPFRETEEG
ncbi:MAG: DUF2254 domain-containing protein [Verrucomicrobiae bacterium]|nr:DUF2254 domain-containing protein [Verrucomicrobiae bacterium]